MARAEGVLPRTLALSGTPTRLKGKARIDASADTGLVGGGDQRPLLSAASVSASCGEAWPRMDCWTACCSAAESS